MPLLTIAIPTYNRAAKVDRLLGELTRQILESNLQDSVDVLVSDNASVDDTQAVVSRRRGSDAAGVAVDYFRQPANLGVDANILTLYERATSPFIWWMGSDDLPVPGTMELILETLKSENPDMITGSFRQPGTGKVFNFEKPVVLVSNPRQCIEHLWRQQKISSQVLRRIDLRDTELALLREELGNGWMHFALAFTVLGRAVMPRVALISDYMAVCDEDYNLLEWTPGCYLQMHKAMRHPFVTRNCPELAEEVRVGGYRTAIGLCFAVKTGRFRAQSEAEYDKFIRDLEWRPGELVKHPGTLVRLLTVKSGTAKHLGPLIRHVMARLRRPALVAPSGA